MTEIRTVSRTGGEKGTKPERMDLLPPEALQGLARVYGFGAEKYTPHNYRRGYEWSKSYAAMQRHANQWWAGEDLDPESGESHLLHVAWHAFALFLFAKDHPDFDDRFSTEGVPA